MSNYDSIGRRYASARQADPRITAAIYLPLREMDSVINVGAGAGSYEPAQTIAAVEPSAVMIAQRPPGAAPAIQAAAEAIPLPDNAADAALAVLTVHHWSNLEAGVAELQRIARRRIVILTYDPTLTARYWLLQEYLPDLARTDPGAAVPIERLVAALNEGGTTSVTPVLVPHDCTDGFTAAFWRRPQAYLDPTVRAGMSVLAAADPDIIAAGMDRLAADLENDAWHQRHADLLGIEEFDAGYRLLVTDLTTT